LDAIVIGVDLFQLGANTIPYVSAAQPDDFQWLHQLMQRDVSVVWNTISRHWLLPVIIETSFGT